MVLENRVSFRLSFEKTIAHPVPGRTSISTAILVLTPSYSWRIITRYIVSRTWCRFRFLIWLSCFSIYNHDVRVWQDYPYTLASCNRLYYPCLPFSHAADLRLEFMEHHPQYVADGNSMGFLSDDGGHKYNLCHCKFLISTIPRRWLAVLVWSNFEIADMNFWRGPAYTDFFNYLDSKGGFYYEVGAMLRYRTAKMNKYAFSVGATHPYIALQLRCLPKRSRYISGTRSGTSTTHTRIAPRKRRPGSEGSVRAVSRRVLVRTPPWTGGAGWSGNYRLWWVLMYEALGSVNGEIVNDVPS